LKADHANELDTSQHRCWDLSAVEPAAIPQTAAGRTPELAKVPSVPRTAKISAAAKMCRRLHFCRNKDGAAFHKVSQALKIVG